MILQHNQQTVDIGVEHFNSTRYTAPLRVRSHSISLAYGLMPNLGVD